DSIVSKTRRGWWDSNPRYGYPYNGFRVLGLPGAGDVRPKHHSSKGKALGMIVRAYRSGISAPINRYVPSDQAHSPHGSRKIVLLSLTPESANTGRVAARSRTCRGQKPNGPSRSSAARGSAWAFVTPRCPFPSPASSLN